MQGEIEFRFFVWVVLADRGAQESSRSRLFSSLCRLTLSTGFASSLPSSIAREKTRNSVTRYSL
jgi:hypothetical protein